MQVVFINKCKSCEIRNQMFFNAMRSVWKFRTPHSTDNPPIWQSPPFYIPPPPPHTHILFWQDSQQYRHIEIPDKHKNKLMWQSIFSFLEDKKTT